MMKELHVTLTVMPISKQEINELREQMSRMTARLNKKSNFVQMTDTQEKEKEKDKEKKEENTDTRKIQTLETVPEAAVSTKTMESDADNGDVDNEHEKENNNDNRNSNTNLIDEILKLDQSEKERMKSTMEKEKGDNASASKKKKKKNKNKNKRGKKHKGAVQAGFLLNNNNFDLSNDQNLRYNKKNTKRMTVNKSGKNDEIIKELSDFEYEFRERLNRIVLVCRISNIIESTVDVTFNTSSVIISFETEKNSYYKCLNLRDEIDTDKSSFDLNSKNLLLMIIKKDDTIWDGVEKVMDKVEKSQSVIKDESKSVEDTGIENINDDNVQSKGNITDELLNDECTMELE